MTPNHLSISLQWQEKLKRFHDDHVPDQRIHIRLQGEEEAKALLKTRLGQFDQSVIKQFLDALNRDWWNGKEKKDRFMPAFYGSLANHIAKEPDAFNKWAKTLWETEDAEIPKLLDEFWISNEISGAGTSLPTAILYLRDPEKYAIWLPIFEEGLKSISPFKLEKGRTGSNYEQFNQHFQQVRNALGFSPQSMDIILSRAAKEISNDQSFDNLFQEFLSTYLETVEGQNHLKNYAKQREAAKKNYKELISKKDHGEDITDLVLLKCLPHADTMPNRGRGAWVHLAPSITKDIKQWYENSGLVSPGHWPAIANAIFAFFKLCFDAPNKLSDHCHYFQQACPSKGFQLGMMTPFLNAIDPEHFMIVNNKPRLVINFFEKKNFSNSLAEYPDINKTILAFINAKTGLLSTAEDKKVLAGDIFDQFCHWMVGIKKFNFSDKQVFIIAAETDDRWLEWHSNEYTSIRMDEIGDLSGVSKSDFKKLRDQMIAKHSNQTQKAINQVWQFAKIKEGDRVIAIKETEILGIGTVTGPYYFAPNTADGHRLPVTWADLNQRNATGIKLSGMLQKIDPSLFEQLMNPPNGVPGTRHGNRHNKFLSVTECAQKIGFDEKELNCWIDGINRKKQAIIYGPPGTGKTFAAKLIADHLVGAGPGFKKIIQFHPEYAYQDFMQGIRPVTKDGVLHYEVMSGIFYKFCEDAEKNNGICVLIIDEINRANLARVFGELMFLLEYRDNSVELPGGGSFKIPDNVRIIGTMNTADRSIALVDYALRRRFAFLKLGPNYHLLEKFHESSGYDATNLIKILYEINTQIDDANYELGISFFLAQDLDNQIENIWKMEIEPYLEEYFFDSRDKVNLFRWENIKSRLQL